MDKLTEHVNGVAVIRKANLEFHFEVDGKIGGDLADRLAAYEDTGLEPEEVAKLAQDQQDGLLVRFPCKRGDTINRFRWSEDNGIIITSDAVTNVVRTRRGFTIHTKKMFHPIRTEVYEFAPVSGYPYALADFYIGTRAEAEAAINEKETKR